MLWLGKPDLQITWEPESSLPFEVIQEFEKEIKHEAYEETASQYGYNSSIIMIADSKQETQPSKKARRERPVIQDSDG